MTVLWGGRQPWRSGIASQLEANMSKEKVVGAPSAEPQPLKSDERDQRVAKLLKMKSREDRLKQVLEWVRTGKIDQPTSLDLMKIVTREAELTEVATAMRKLIKDHAVRNPQVLVEQKNFAELCSKLPGLVKKLEITAGDE
jgi:hypothetical protein